MKRFIKWFGLVAVAPVLVLFIVFVLFVYEEPAPRTVEESERVIIEELSPAEVTEEKVEEEVPIVPKKKNPVVDEPFSPEDAYKEGYNRGYEHGYEDGRMGKSKWSYYDCTCNYEGEFREKYSEGYSSGYDDGYYWGFSAYAK